MPEEIPAETRAAVCDAIFARRKIEAIKVYREATGVGLKESKEFVEALEARLREESPEKFAAKSGGAGCSAVVAALTIAGLGMVLLLIGR